MVVKVSKPEINVREKLSELDYGVIPFEKMPTGSVIQVVQNLYTSTATIAVSLVNDTGYGMGGWFYTNVYCTINPRLAGSKIILNSTINFASTNHGERISFKLIRETASGGIEPITGMPAINGNRRMCLASSLYMNQGSDEHLNEVSMQSYDMPNTTEPITYKLYVNQNANGISFFVNKPDNNGNAYYIPTTISSVQATETKT